MNHSDEIEHNYSGAYGGHLRPGKKAALIVVDIVTAYLDPSSPLYLNGQDAVDSNIRLVHAARIQSIPVVFTNVTFIPGGIDGGLFYKKVPALALFDKGSEYGAFAGGLEPQPGDVVISKQYASAFFGTSLASTLKALNIDTAYITGFSTSGCVRATALDALQNGFAPFVIRDGCADRHPAPHEANLFDLQAKYAEVISEAEALEQFNQYA
jgi:maleamate amidohydrolase